MGNRCGPEALEPRRCGKRNWQAQETARVEGSESASSVEAARTASAARRLARGPSCRISAGPLEPPWPLELSGLHAILGSMSPTPCKTRAFQCASLLALLRCYTATLCCSLLRMLLPERLELCSLLKGLPMRQASHSADEPMRDFTSSTFPDEAPR